MAAHFDLLDFEVGDSGQELRVPIDEPLVPVDQALIVKLHERLEDRARHPLVHGEPLARPVAGGAEPLQLIDDDPPRLGLPLPHPRQKFFPSHRAAGRFLAVAQLAFDHHLGGDAGMVGAGLPQHVAAAHAFKAAQHILKRVVEGVAGVQRARNIGGRDDDRERLGVAPVGAAGRKGPRLFPRRRNTALDVGEVVILLDHLTCIRNDGRQRTRLAGRVNRRPIFRQ